MLRQQPHNVLKSPFEHSITGQTSYFKSIVIIAGKILSDATSALSYLIRLDSP